MNDKWYAVWTRSRHEFVAAIEIEQKGFSIFLPTVERLSRRKDRRKVITAPLFPGYLFVKTEMNVENYIQIARSVGVANVVGYHMGHAEAVKDEEIQSIQILLEGKVPIEKHVYIPAGSSVRVLSGPFKGVVGIVLEHRGKRKLVVQVDLMRQAVACEFNFGDVEPLEPLDSLQRSV